MSDAWKRRCSAKAKRTGVQCGRWAIRGASVCYVHGAASKKARAAAARRMQVQRVASVAARLGLPIKMDPTVALLGQVSEAAGNVALWRSLIDELVSAVGGAIVDVVDSEESRPRREWREGIAGPNHLGDQTLHVWVQAYNDERERLVRFSLAAIRAGVEERQVRVAEQQGQLLVDVIRGVLADLQIPLSADVQRIVGRHLQRVSAIDVSEVDRDA